MRVHEYKLMCIFVCASVYMARPAATVTTVWRVGEILSNSFFFYSCSINFSPNPGCGCIVTCLSRPPCDPLPSPTQVKITVQLAWPLFFLLSFPVFLFASNLFLPTRTVDLRVGVSFPSTFDRTFAFVTSFSPFFHIFFSYFLSICVILWGSKAWGWIL